MKLENLLERELRSRIEKGEVICHDCKTNKAEMIYGEYCLCNQCVKKRHEKIDKQLRVLFIIALTSLFATILSELTQINIFICLAIAVGCINIIFFCKRLYRKTKNKEFDLDGCNKKGDILGVKTDIKCHNQKLSKGSVIKIIETYQINEKTFGYKFEDIETGKCDIFTNFCVCSFVGVNQNFAQKMSDTEIYRRYKTCNANKSSIL